MKIDGKVLDDLSSLARKNLHLRQHLDLRTTTEDGSQRMLNAMEPNTIMPIHRHPYTSESMVIIRGKLLEKLYDDEGNLTDEFIMEPGGE